MTDKIKTTRRSFIKSLAAIGSLPAISFALPSTKSPIDSLMDEAFASLPDYCGRPFKSVLNNPSHNLAVAVWLPESISKNQIDSYFKSHASKFSNLESPHIYIYDFGQYEEAHDSTNPQTPSKIRLAAMTTSFDEFYQGSVTLDISNNNLN